MRWIWPGPTPAIQAINEAHLKNPDKSTKDDLAKKLPKSVSAVLVGLLALDDGAGLPEALLTAGEAALELDLEQDFWRIEERLKKFSPEFAPKLGCMVSRARFLARGIDGLDTLWLERFADVVDLVLDAYAEVFGFTATRAVQFPRRRSSTNLTSSCFSSSRR